MHCVPNRNSFVQKASMVQQNFILALLQKFYWYEYCLPLLYMITYTYADDAKLVKSINVSLTFQSQLYVSNNHITIYVCATSYESDNVLTVEKHLYFFNHYPAAVS